MNEENRCLDPVCKDTVDRLELEVFGKPGTDTAIRTCMRKLVPKSWIWTFFATFGVVTVIGLVTIWTDVQTGKTDNLQSVLEIRELKKEVTEIRKKQISQGRLIVRVEVLQEALLRGLNISIPKKERGNEE